MKTYYRITSQMFKLRFLLLFFVAMIAMSTTQAQELKHGFKLIEKKFVKEVNANCLYYEHVKSGAHLLKIESDDDNKTFGITFKTIPSSDNGVAHITEHSVLNGSKKFPSKSPFDILSKGSLNTFMNAFTSRDATAYPFASMNEKDYFNLMDVYLDATLNPMIYTEDRILQQEGWHYELNSLDEPVTIKGVVYNEMKGAFSNPQRDLYYQILKNVYPQNVYGFESGGTPAAIPSLTQEQFEAFHKKFYHPENSYIFLYGNADVDKELAFIDQNYLSHFTRTGNVSEVTDQPDYAAPKDVTEYYPVMEGNTENQTFLTMSFLAGNNTDYTLGMALNILCEVLVNQESAPVRQALQQAGIGQDVTAFAQDNKQNMLTIWAMNANPEDKEKFSSIVLNTLKDVVAKGIDKDEIDGVLSRMEFQVKEGSDAQKGITYMNQIQAGWFYASNPFMGLEYNKRLETLRANLKTDYYEKLVERYVLNNSNRVLLTFAPKVGLDKERTAQLEKELADYKASLTNKQKSDLIESTKNLIAYQNAEDTPEAVATIPMLELKDINPKASYPTCEDKKMDGIRVLHHDAFTNGIIYVNYNFDLNTLSQDLIPYAALLKDILVSINTKNYTYGKLNHALNTTTGGFNTSLSTYLVDYDDSKLVANFVLNSKVMKEKLSGMNKLATEVLLNSQVNDTARLREVLMRRQAQLESYAQQEGYSVASSRLPSYYSHEGYFNELTSGVEYYRFISSLMKDFNANSSMVVEKLNSVIKNVFTKGNLMATVTCSKEDLPLFSKELKSFVSTLPSEKGKVQKWNFVLEKKNEGFQTPSRVQYVLMGYNMKKLGYKWDGSMRVLSQILSTDWLKNQIRVIGGAYGGFCNFSADGMVAFSSYRDPNLTSTFNTYMGSVDYLNKFEADQTAMTRYIIGTIAGLDSPLTLEQKGSKAFRFYLANRTQEAVQADRDAILKATPAQIRSYAPMVKAILDQKAACVYGNAEKLTAEPNDLKLTKISE